MLKVDMMRLAKDVMAYSFTEVDMKIASSLHWFEKLM